MKRARATDNSSAVSLFPFLAVLVCTMGSLIVLLVVMARQARLRAAQRPAVVDSSAAREAADVARLDVTVQQLEQSRSLAAQQLAEDRLVLSHLEDHIRRLREQMQRVQSAAKQLANVGAASAEQRRRDEAEVARLKQLIAAAKERLDAARQEAQRRRPSYTIIPYRGENGTDRRPIYIECRADAVILQPEGVVLEAEDFAAPLGPGNPLAAALRAAREYLAERQTTATLDTVAGARMDAYPLLLVRPDGIAAYYKARQALASWDAEFGYELVEADCTLEYPVPDPQLADRESRAVEAARQRRARLARAAPSQFRGGRSWRVRAAPNRGGFERFTPPESPSADDRHGRGSFAGRRRGGDRQPAGGAPAAAAGTAPPSEPAPAAAATAAAAGAGSAAQGTFGAGAAGGGGLATQRGPNWALPNAGRDAVPISRPVRIVLRHDRVAILPDDPAGAGHAQPGTVIPFSGRTMDAVDPFVSGLWDHIGTWGIAGQGMYWRPVLHLRVAADAGQRAAQFKALLEDSGLEFVEKGTTKP